MAEDSRQRSQQSRQRSQQSRQRSQQQRNRQPKPAERSVSGYVATDQEKEAHRILDTERAKNARWSLFGGLYFGVPIAIIVALATVWINVAGGIVLGILSGIFADVVATNLAPTAVKSNIGAVPIEPGMNPRLDALFNGLSASMGVALPSIAMLDDPIANAAIFSSKKESTVVVTTGLLATMTVVELEGVLAHLLAHLRLESVKRGTTAAGLAIMLGGIGRKGNVSHVMMGKGRLFRADEIAASIVRYPVGLASALAKMEQGPLPEPSSFFSSPLYRTIRWIFIDPSIARRARAEEIGDLDATGPRRQMLEEL